MLLSAAVKVDGGKILKTHLIKPKSASNVTATRKTTSLTAYLALLREATKKIKFFFSYPATKALPPPPRA